MHVVGQVAHEVDRDLLGVRPRRVGVRVVGLEGGVVDADLVERLDAVPVAEEAAVHLPVVVGRRRLGNDVAHAAPRAVLDPHVVGALEDVRDPADLALGVRELQVRDGARAHPENRKSVSDAIALPKLSVACTAAGASGDVAGIFDDEPMCMHTTVCVSSHAAKNGSQ